MTKFFQKPRTNFIVKAAAEPTLNVWGDFAKGEYDWNVMGYRWVAKKNAWTKECRSHGLGRDMIEVAAPDAEASGAGERAFQEYFWNLNAAGNGFAVDEDTARAMYARR